MPYVNIKITKDGATAEKKAMLISGGRRGQEELARRLKTKKTAISRIENHAEDINLSAPEKSPMPSEKTASKDSLNGPILVIIQGKGGE